MGTCGSAVFRAAILSSFFLFLFFLFIRDWRGLAHFTGIRISTLAQCPNPFSEILKLWDDDKMSKGAKRPSLGDLLDILGRIDRWDVYDDSEPLMRMYHYFVCIIIFI